MTAAPWLDWLNTAPLAEIVSEVRAELGPGADTRSKLVRRLEHAIRRQRASGTPFASLSQLAAAPNIGKRSRRLMESVLAHHGYEGAPLVCLCCPLHCPESHG